MIKERSISHDHTCDVLHACSQCPSRSTHTRTHYTPFTSQNPRVCVCKRPHPLPQQHRALSQYRRGRDGALSCNLRSARQKPNRPTKTARARACAHHRNSIVQHTTPPPLKTLAQCFLVCDAPEDAINYTADKHAPAGAHTRKHTARICVTNGDDIVLCAGKVRARVCAFLRVC